jgi:hypothetical protein
LVPGAGASEIELARRVAEFGEKTPGLAQHAIRKWAEAMEVIPKTLAENAGLSAEDVVSALYKAHGEGQVDAGVDIDVSRISCLVERCILMIVPGRAQWRYRNHQGFDIRLVRCQGLGVEVGVSATVDELKLEC